MLRLAPRTLDESHDHGAVAVGHDGQRQEEACVLQSSDGQNPVVSVDAVIVEGAGGKGGVSVLRHGEEHQIGHRYIQANQPQRNARQVHRPPPTVLQPGQGVNNGQIPINGDARQQETPAQEVELARQAHQLAGKVAKNPTGDVLQDAKREGGQEQKVGHSQVQQVDLADAQETPAAQEDSHHQAIPHHTQQEEAAVKEAFKCGLEAPQSAVLVATVGLVVFRVNIICIVGFYSMLLQKINKSLLLHCC